MTLSPKHGLSIARQGLGTAELNEVAHASYEFLGLGWQPENGRSCFVVWVVAIPKIGAAKLCCGYC